MYRANWTIWLLCSTVRIEYHVQRYFFTQAAACTDISIHRQGEACARSTQPPIHTKGKGDMPVTIHSISHQEARQVVNAIVEHAAMDGGDPIAIAVVDASAHLIYFAAMDGVMQASIRLSQSKAY